VQAEPGGQQQKRPNKQELRFHWIYFCSRQGLLRSLRGTGAVEALGGVGGGGVEEAEGAGREGLGGTEELPVEQVG
jgi:hypothetical protein